MKKIIALLTIITLFVSCKEEVVNKPERLIEKDVMVDIMYDLSILEAIRNQNPASLDTFKINSRDYIFKKYKIDSVQFAKSNVYYASDYNEYKSMFEQINKRLQANTKSVDSLIKLKKKKKIIKKGEKQAVISRDTTKLN
ncbi:DUF4296 domain-containing protein [Flavobacterium yafengii]|uniref:DUF4296 domain-containing protein n=1 Tax=Flavobacterium yafengii TaxID=3041253 RepID=A0AAW6TNN6_9FLAO|nr:DUF4296 domain-containing protein [Flavobacterium yafengii]MDI5948727.1 DUF4296 domain-containing protein [Flavobacterium yafengii]MDI6045273.1 DUF4296 domain-containing protein [Flavobacterium yafengii]